VQDDLTESSSAIAIVTVEPSPLNGAAFGELVTVSAGIRFSELSRLPSPMYLRGTMLSAHGVMRRESVPEPVFLRLR
jgi:hypothetical protein